MVPIDPDRSLLQRLKNLGEIATYSRDLGCGEQVARLFPEPHSQDYLHILVQYDEISTLGGELLVHFACMSRTNNVVELLTSLAHL